MRGFYLKIIFLFFAGISFCHGQCFPCPGPLAPERKGKELRSIIQELPDYNKTTLTGDWGGERTKLAEKGILLSLDYSQIMQGNAHGGANTNKALRYPGLADLTLRLDLARMGLWEGGHGCAPWPDASRVQCQL
jgi:hypothetical protein